MAISTYDELQAAVTRWHHRGDMATVIPDLITLAEVRLNRDLKLRHQETFVSGTLASAASGSVLGGGDGPVMVLDVPDSPTTFDGTVVNIPPDLSTLTRFIVVGLGREWELKYRAAEDFPTFSGNTGIPQYFTELNQQYFLSPKADGAYDYTIYYTANFPALSSTNQTNWLLTNAPDVYLYATLLEAAPFTKDDSRVELWATAYSRAVETIMTQDAMNQYPTQSALQVRSDVNR